MLSRSLSGLFALAIMFVGLAKGQAAYAQARVELVTIHSPSVEGNLEGNHAAREVYVVLPPGYDANSGKRYPVVYFLHGILAKPKNYLDSINVAEAVEQAAAEGNPLIVVLPDGWSKHAGSMYSNSPTVGDFEGFIAKDVVAYVDAHFRTLASRESRGLSGHSMGGYGTLRIAMKYPEVFSSIYAMSSCCLPIRPITPAGAAAASAARDDGAPVPLPVQLDLAVFAAWSPDPGNPPNYIYTGLKDDETIDPLVSARFAANSPIVMAGQYVPALKRLEAIALDMGDKDFIGSGSKEFHLELDRYGIANSYDEYDGDHGNRLPERFRSKLLPFFGTHLDRE